MSLALEALETKFKQNSLPPEASEAAALRLGLLRSAAPDTFEHVDTRHYLTELLTFPWDKPPQTRVDVGKLNEALELGAYAPAGMTEALAEFLADIYGGEQAGLPASHPTPVLAGPPGIGKRTLARKIGKAIGRPVEIIDLRLTENDADLFGVPTDRVRGRPGLLIRALQSAGRRDAVIVLAGMDWAVRSWQDHGMNLLKFVFDAEERRRFRDKFLDVDIDLSSVLFVITIGSLQYLPPEVFGEILPLEWAGYTKRRKVEIALADMIPALLAKHSLTSAEFQIVDEAVEVLIEDYSDEAGLTELGVLLDRLCRKVAAGKAAERSAPAPIDAEAIRTLMGPPRNYGAQGQVLVRPGMAKGLVETPAGAALEVVEIAVVPGAEGFGSAGQVGDTLARMVDVAYHYLRSRMTEMDISARQLYEYAYRVHVRGLGGDADTPSLGLAVVVAFMSQIRDRLVDPEMALIGEITLNGRVLGAPGLQHKLLAAHRNGIRRVVLPKENQEDLDELPGELRAEMTVVAVDDVEQAIRVALQGYSS